MRSCLWPMPDIGPASYDEEAYKERDRRNGEYGDRPAEAGTDLRSGTGGGVAAHAAALRVGRERARQQQRHEANAQQVAADEVFAAHLRALLEEDEQAEEEDPEDTYGSQYQAVQSTKICQEAPAVVEQEEGSERAGECEDAGDDLGAVRSGDEGRRSGCWGWRQQKRPWEARSSQAIHVTRRGRRCRGRRWRPASNT